MTNQDLQKEPVSEATSAIPCAVKDNSGGDTSTENALNGCGGIIVAAFLFVWGCMLALNEKAPMSTALGLLFMSVISFIVACFCMSKTVSKP